jgi:hypothetical protein
VGGLVQGVKGQPAAGRVDRVVPAVQADLGLGQALQRPGELAAQPFGLEVLPVVEAGAVAQPEPGRSTQAGQTASGGWPWARQPASSSSNRATSRKKLVRANPTVVRSAASQPGPTALFRVDRVRRSAPRACSVS